jgi:hypothetical protein
MAEAQNQNDTIAEIVSDLEMYHEDGEPIEVWFADDPGQEYCEGFVAAIGTDFVLIGRLFQRSWLNGMRAIRLTAIKEILPAEDTEFILRAQRARGQPIPPPVPLHAATLAELLACVCDHYPIVVLDDDPAREPTSVAGIIREVSDEVVRIRQISLSGHWVEGTYEVALRHVNNVYFGSQYEETLRLIGELPDA